MILSNKSRKYSNNEGAVGLKSSELGLATLEAAGALVVILPLLLIAVGVAIMLHDQSVYRAAPGEAIRMVVTPSIQFNSTPHGGVLSFSDSDANAIAIGLVQQMGKTVPEQVIIMTQPSYKGCVWLLSVNSVTGRSNGIKRSVCHEAGFAAGQLSFTGELKAALTEPVGIPLLDGSGQFAPSVVLLGAKISAKGNRKITGVKIPDLEYGIVQLPRGEITI